MSHTRRKTKQLRRKFDNCVRSVQKTVKARKGSTKKQAAYAICTSTVLGKKGGKIIGEGADTCVFSPPVACTGTRYTISGEQVTPDNSVSRIVQTSEKEHEKQQFIHLYIKTELHKAGKLDLMRFFLFGSYHCQPNTTDDDFMENVIEKGCSFGTRIISKAEKPNNDTYVNIVTPKYDSDLEKGGKLTKSIDVTRKGIHDLMTVLTYINKFTLFVHNDTHFGNIGWKGDQIVLTDWGRVKTRFTKPNFLDYVKGEITEDYKKYSQHVYHVFLKFDDDEIFELYDYTHKNGRVLSIVWDILGILGSAVKYHLVSAQSANELFVEIKNLLKRALPKNEVSMSREELINALKSFDRKSSGYLSQFSGDLLNQKTKEQESKRKEYTNRIEVKEHENDELLNIDDFSNELRTKIDELFAKNTPVPLQAPAVEPPEALSPTDLNLIQADLFQRSSSSSIGSLVVTETESEGGSFQKRTRTHNIHKQTIRNRQRKNRKVA